MARPERSGRRGLTLLLALLLCGALSVLHHRTERAGRPDPVVGAVRDAGLVPAQGLTDRVGRWWRDTVGACFAGPGLARQNDRLQAAVTQLTLQNQDLQHAQDENARLRALLHYQRRSARQLLAAEVVALKPSPLVDTLTLARGRRDGVLPQTVVLAPNGALAGQVLDASFTSCSVLLLSDAGSSVGAQASRRGKPGPIGICQGDRQGHLALTDLPREADVRPGDLVTTSGLGGVYPKGILIGVVQSVLFDKTRALKTARLRPAADFDHLENVFLLPRSPAPADLPADTDTAPPTPVSVGAGADGAAGSGPPAASPDATPSVGNTPPPDDATAPVPPSDPPASAGGSSPSGTATP